MMKKTKYDTLPVLALALGICLCTPVAAGQWIEENGSWLYLDTNQVQDYGWKWIDSNQDGLYECYYIQENGLIAQNTNIDGYTLNADGQWTSAGELQQRSLPDWIQVMPERLSASSLQFLYPYLTLSDTATSSEVNEWIQQYVEKLQNKPEGDITGHSTQNNLSYDFLLSPSNRYIGLSFRNDTYSEGAAHGISTMQYLTLTPDQGLLSLSDLGGASLIQAITSSVRNTLKTRTANGSLFLYVDPDDVNVPSNTGSWMLAADGLHIIFQQYEIAPYAAGLIDICVPYAELLPYMNAYGSSLVQ